jgi:hypothetical protein
VTVVTVLVMRDVVQRHLNFVIKFTLKTFQLNFQFERNAILDEKNEIQQPDWIKTVSKWILHKSHFPLPPLSTLLHSSPSGHHPILDMSGASRMIAATDLYQDRQNQDRYHDLPHTCRLCRARVSHESRQIALQQST